MVKKEFSDKEGLENVLAKICTNAKLPKYYKYFVDKEKKILTLTVLKDGLVANMQNNDSAFESWAIILKFYVPYVNEVVIDWETIDWMAYEDETRKDKEKKHYNRFMYRLTKFDQAFEWVKLKKNIPNIIPNALFCNCPNGEAAEKDEHQDKKSEGYLECEFVEKEKAKGIYDSINHQFPVGLFENKVSRDTHFTTGQKSAIDIWAIKDNQFYIFELKKPGNIPLGIISELMFYTNVVDDLLAHRIKFESENDKVKKAIEKNYRGFREFYNSYIGGKIRKINSILLAYDFHPLITEDLLKFINNSNYNKNITFSKQNPK
ncbi:MAG: hypothetical protein IKO90_02365 [Bacteroidales bacterium]|nr:hypothetical protein [Bacteroidales bacterium]